MKLLSIFFLIIACSLSLCAQDKTKKENICITEQEYRVYEVVGVGNYQNQTTSYPFSDHVQNQFPNISPDAVADFNERNGQTYLLRCLLRKGQEMKKLKKYYGTTTNINFSRIGFNRGETEALVYVSWSAVGNYCGAEFFQLKKENDKWTIVKKYMTVIC